MLKNAPTLASRPLYLQHMKTMRSTNQPINQRANVCASLAIYFCFHVVISPHFWWFPPFCFLVPPCGLPNASWFQSVVSDFCTCVISLAVLSVGPSSILSVHKFPFSRFLFKGSGEYLLPSDYEDNADIASGGGESRPTAKRALQTEDREAQMKWQHHQYLSEPCWSYSFSMYLFTSFCHPLKHNSNSSLEHCFFDRYSGQ